MSHIPLNVDMCADEYTEQKIKRLNFLIENTKNEDTIKYYREVIEDFENGYTLKDAEWDAETHYKSNICRICKAKVNNPKHHSHVNSNRHQNALMDLADVQPKFDRIENRARQVRKRPRRSFR